MALRVESDARGDGKQPTTRGGRLSPPSSTLGATGSLPLELTSFVGRRHELTEAKNLLVGSRLVTLTGIGGVGKTRLALRIATAVQREYSEGVRLVELGELHDESSLVDAVAAAVGVRDYSVRPLREVLIEFLIPREVLLVLDEAPRVPVHQVAEELGCKDTRVTRCRAAICRRRRRGIGSIRCWNARREALISASLSAAHRVWRQRWPASPRGHFYPFQCRQGPRSGIRP
jgi:hypothetical protein